MARELTQANQRRYRALRQRYIHDYTFRVVTDMYRNLHGEPVVAAHFFAEHDTGRYTVRQRGAEVFAPVAAGYSREELDFLRERRVKPV